MWETNKSGMYDLQSLPELNNPRPTQASFSDHQDLLELTKISSFHALTTLERKVQGTHYR